jgi:hypothetical protein
MMQPKHWLDWPRTLNARGAHELLGVAPQLSDSRRSSRQSRPARSRGEPPQYCVNFGVSPRVCSGKNGAIQVPGLGLEMRDLAAKQDKG